MTTMIDFTPTRWMCETDARGAYDNREHDVRHEAILFNHGRYTDVRIAASGNVVFTLANGAHIALRPTDLVHVSLLHGTP